MSLSLKENKDSSNTYIKLEIYESHVCPEMNVPLPYGIVISFGNFPEKNIEPINQEKNRFKPPLNQFSYYFDKNLIDYDNLKEKEFIISSYTTSIFILKKNFASVKIPLSPIIKENKKKNWYFLKDINNNNCIKLLISIDINIPNQKEIPKENKKNNLSRANTNFIMNNHNTYLISTNYNSSQGNSLSNLTNNNTININKNLSQITLMGKSNSFIFDSKNEQINNNILHQEKNEDNSIIINDTDIEQSEEEKEEIIKNDIEQLINIKNSELDKKQSMYDFNKDKHEKNKTNSLKKIYLLEKYNTQYKNKIQNIEKLKSKNEIKKANLIKVISILENYTYRQNIQKELDNYEKAIFDNLNFISNNNNNLEQILFIENKIHKGNNKPKSNLTPKKAESFNKIDMIDIYDQDKNKAKKNILCLNKTIPHNPLYIKKMNMNISSKAKRKINNYINTGRQLNKKKDSPFNYQYKTFGRKLSTSISNISNSENINNEYGNKILKTEGKITTNKISNDSINNSKFKKIEKITIKRKSLRTNINLKIPFNQISVNKNFQSNSNYQKKYSSNRTNLNKEKNSTKKNLMVNNKKYSNNTINKSKILKAKTIELGKTFFNTIDSYNINKSIDNTQFDRNITSIENISPNDNIKVNKTTFTKINNFGKKKLSRFDQKKSNNNQKSLNIDNFKVFKNDSRKIKNNYIRLNFNENNKKKNLTFRNYLNLSGNTILLNFQKKNQGTREKQGKNANQKILLAELIN